MNQNQEELLALRQSLLKAQETGDQAEQTVVRDQACVGRLSRMDALQAQAMSIETGRRRRDRAPAPYRWAWLGYGNVVDG